MASQGETVRTEPLTYLTTPLPDRCDLLGPLLRCRCFRLVQFPGFSHFVLLLRYFLVVDRAFERDATVGDVVGDRAPATLEICALVSITGMVCITDYCVVPGSFLTILLNELFESKAESTVISRQAILQVDFLTGSICHF